ncbi:excisionase family DNA-binding protein [Sedimentisphaera salicampi]|uniref:excisionase family DNA-binding protein n=1 Tax=Sedimentisphaera salicampi TaxID=1941349 RepID=UPI000B9AB7A3|nr:DNA binding domain, excisionase family [Sedimentisphaera salicampi]
MLQNRCYLTTKQVAQRLNVGRTKFFESLSSGTFGVRPLRFGKKLLFDSAELDDYFETSKEKGRFLTADEWRNVKSGGKK